MTVAAGSGLLRHVHRLRGQDGVSLSENQALAWRGFAREHNPGSLALFALLIVGLFGVGLGTAAAQNITGTVSDGVQPLQGIQVMALDAVNAQILSQTTTDVNGHYDTGNIPIGTYRIRFSDVYVGGLPAFYAPAFFGVTTDTKGGNRDYFCSATTVNVPAGNTATADEQLSQSQPTLVVDPPPYYSISGIVMDADTLAPLAGVQVSIVGGSNARPLLMVMTDSVGHWEADFTTYEVTIKARFSDPSNVYLPRFSGAGGLDDFCGGTQFSLGGDLSQLDQEYLVPIPPDQMTQNLVEQIQNLTVPSSVSTVLGAPLTRAVSLLTDGNTSNDSGACGQLTSFISRVDAEEKKGQLTSADADSLRQSAEAVLTQLGCQ
jgi:hypothetical protein